MKRWLFNILAALSLLVFALSVTLWGRSWFVGDGLYHDEPTTRGSVDYSLLSSCGSINFWREADEYYSGSPATAASRARTGGWAHTSFKPKPFTFAPAQACDRLNFRFAGLQIVYAFWTHGPAGGWTSQTQLILPLWLFLPFAIPPILSWRKRRRQTPRGFAVIPAADGPQERSAPPLACN